MITRVFEAIVAATRRTEPVNSDTAGRTPVSYVIEDYFDGVPYLTRVVFPRVFGLRPLLHHFHRGDGDRALHNHPWKWSLSIILKGEYVEERKNGRFRRVRWLNFLRDTDFHRVVELKGDVWTLFVTGRRIQDWGFLEKGKVTPHKEYINRVRAELGR